MLMRVTAAQFNEVVDFHAYLEEHPDLIEHIAIMRAVFEESETEDIIVATLRWVADAMYHYGSPTDIRIFPTKENGNANTPGLLG